MPRRRTEEEPDRFPFEDYGDAVGGPLVIGMVDWMIEELRHNPPKKILFLARDGQIVQEVWRRRVPADLAGIPTQYLLASRRALRMAALQTLDNRALDFLTTSPYGLTFSGLLQRIGVTPTQTKKQGPDDDQPWRCEQLAGPERCRVTAMLRQFEPQIRARAEKERAAFLAYLRETLPEMPRHIALVDIGWHGSLQMALGELLKSTPRPPERINGYYLGLFAAAGTSLDGVNVRRGFLLDRGVTDEREAEIRRFVEVLELFFASPDPSLLYFCQDRAGRARPVYEPTKLNPGELRALRGLRAGILRFAETHPEPVTADTAYSAARRLGLAPTQKEAAAFGRFRLPRGFGEGAPLRSLAEPGQTCGNLLHWKRFVLRFKEALWRSGFWAQLSGPERALLSVLSPEGTRPLRGKSSLWKPREKP